MKPAFDLVIVAPNGDAWCIDRAGMAALAARRRGRLLAEAEALAAIKRAATPPEDCGPEIPVAPARGPTAVFTPWAVRMTPNGPRYRDDGYLGRRAARRGDAFDVMTDQARRAHAKSRRALGDQAPPFLPPFTLAQIDVARQYAALVERCEASGMKCASLEVQRAGGGTGGDREMAMLRDLELVRRLRARIDGLVIGGARHRIAIPARFLVDQVCLAERTLSQVLMAYGWAKKGASVALLRSGLREALDRMLR